MTCPRGALHPWKKNSNTTFRGRRMGWRPLGEGSEYQVPSLFPISLTPKPPLSRFYLIAGGIPLIICGITAAVNIHNYRDHSP